MRHNMHNRKLNRTSSHRKALLKNLAKALIKHEHIQTTLPKAKELRPFVEKIITLSKNNTLVERRKIASIINEKEVVKKLFDTIGERFKSRPGGYTRIVKSGYRYGDSAPMAIIELVEKSK